MVAAMYSPLVPMLILPLLVLVLVLVRLVSTSQMLLSALPFPFCVAHPALQWQPTLPDQRWLPVAGTFLARLERRYSGTSPAWEQNSVSPSRFVGNASAQTSMEHLSSTVMPRPHAYRNLGLPDWRAATWLVVSPLDQKIPLLQAPETVVLNYRRSTIPSAGPR